MVNLRHFLLITAAVALATMAHAQPAGPAPMDRITPAQNDNSIMSTHKQPTAAAEPMPWQQPTTTQPMGNAPVIAAPGAPAMPPKMPFGRGEAGKMAAEGRAAASGAPSTAAVPVVSVDSVEASEAAPPTPVAPGADPVAEDPAMPTELTSPIFGDDPEAAMPRKVLIRALNKVTAQSEMIAIKPGDMVKFGQLEITALSCRTSAPESQTDYAGLLDIAEKTTVKDQTKKLFHGWMYASSPSITALEHPVYDVTMVECKMAIPTVKKEEKEAEKPAKRSKN